MANPAPTEVDEPFTPVTLRMSGTIKTTDTSTQHPDLTIYDFGHEPWRKEAECRGHENPMIFFSAQSTGLRSEIAEMREQAIELCRICPVRWECLATSTRQQYGIFGGYDENERRRIRKRVQVQRRLSLEELTQAIVREGMRVELARLRGVGERKRRR